MNREAMPLRVHSRMCDECDNIEAEHQGSCPVREFAAWVKEQSDNPAYDIHMARLDAEERGLYGTKVFINGPARQANLWCPHRIEKPEKEDVLLFQMRPEGWIGKPKGDEK